ncbi:MAG: hypothetical protein LH479_07315 [Polaromonas sp.]|nr:hypothetical protein [Polaromonas sp.]
MVSTFALSNSRSIAVSGRLVTKRSDNGIALGYHAFWIPLALLTADSNYTATATGSLDGVPFNLSWNFKTKVQLPLSITASAASLRAAADTACSALTSRVPKPP